MQSPAAESPATEPEPAKAVGRSGRRSLPVMLAVIATVLAGLVVAQFLINRLSPHLYNGTVLQQSEAAPPLDGLQYSSGEPADLAAFDGEVTLVFFGYTNCPDVCPATLANVRRALDELDAEQRDRVNTLMISVDPERDDLDTVQSYVELFDPSFRGLGGPTEAIERAATRYGVFYELRNEIVSEDYLVDHTTSLMGIGPDGVLRVLWSWDVAAGALAADVEELLS